MKKPQCPKCKSNKNTIPILYGLPTGEGFDKADRGELKIGGCVVREDNPEWHCKRCKRDF